MSFVSQFEKNMGFADLLAVGVKFRNFLTKCYATDVTFQQGNRSRGNNQEEKNITVKNAGCNDSRWR